MVECTGLVLKLEGKCQGAVYIFHVGVIRPYAHDIHLCRTFLNSERDKHLKSVF